MKSTRYNHITLLGLAICLLLCFPVLSYSAGNGENQGNNSQGAGKKKKDQSLKDLLGTPIEIFIPSDEYLLHVYTRLMRYQTAAQDYYNHATGTPTSPDQYLTIGIKNMSFEGNRNINAEVNAVLNQKLTDNLYLVRDELCHDKDFCHIMYEAGWVPAPKKISKDLVSDVKNVVQYTTYDVEIKFQGKETAYKAIVLYYNDAKGNPVANIVDPGIPLMNTVAKDIMPAVKSPWNSYIYSGLYWQIANEIREKRANGEPLIPEDAPIGYLPGDDQKEVMMMMVAATTAPCTPESQCNPSNNPTNTTKINMVSRYYNSALVVANEIKASLPTTAKITADALATMFVQWSANETLWGTDKLNIEQNNYFGVQNPANTAGLLGGAIIACKRDGNPIPTNSKNACFAPNITWEQQLRIGLSMPSPKTGIPYITVLKAALSKNATVTEAMQAIADNGWNPEPTYGEYVTIKLIIQPTINCMKENGFIK